MKSLLIVLLLTILRTAVFSQPADTLYSAATLRQLSLEELMNIEVTSVSRQPEKLQTVASAIQVITSEDIRHSGAATLPEALRLASNLQVARVNSSQYAISARGFNNVLADKLLVMIDGRTVYTPLYAGVYWDVQNLLLEDIDRIEVISGPGGTLWGANAVNGVINIITKNSEHTKGLFAEVGGGNAIPWLANLRYGGKLSNNISYRIYGLGYKLADTRLLADGKKANDEWSLGQGGVRMDWKKSSKDNITIQGDFYDGFPNPDGVTPVVTMGGNVLARWTRTISQQTGFSIQTYYDHTWRDLLNGFAEKLQTFDVDWQYHFPAGKRHELTSGGDIRIMYDKMNNLELLAFNPAKKTLHLYGTFFQDRITIVPNKLSFTAGTKIEHNNYTGVEYSPNVRIAYTPGTSQTIWTAVSRAVRTPSRIDEDFTLSIAPGVPLIQGSEFKSATLIAYELGYRKQFSKKIVMAVSAYHNVYDHLRSAEPGPPPNGFPITLANGVKGHTNGIELIADWQATDWWRVHGGYTLTKKYLKVKEGSHDLNEARVESNDPDHQVLMQSVFTRKKWNAGIVYRWVNALPHPFVPAYSSLDIRVGYQVTKNVEIKVTGQNLTDERHLEFIPSSPSARLLTRSIYGTIACRL